MPDVALTTQAEQYARDGVAEVEVTVWRRQKPAENGFFPGFADVTEIGTGRLATVYRAREVETNRMVAVKLLNIRDVSPRALESFERESFALGAVSSHPNIVTLFRSFRADDGRPVLVLELCTGAISDRLRPGSGLPVAEVVRVGIKIAGALETAHRAEILHRDVKPQNILITEYGEPALADFGVARLRSSVQTTAGLFDLTTLHVAPELLEGGETSAATDVYGLASSLYQLIAGQPAFPAREGEPPASVALRIRHDPVPPLPADLAPNQLSGLLVAAMAKDKDARPPTAAAFAGELARIQSAQPWRPTPFPIRDGGPPPTPVRRDEPTVRVPIPVPSPPPAASQYPIPPAVAAPEPAVEPVPTWASRARVPAALGASPQLVGDLSLDPMTLRRRVTLRSGRATLIADESGLTVRRWWRRREVPWPDVLGFEPRIDGGPEASDGRLVAHTRTGPVDLPATTRPIADLRYVHALLDAYRERARLLDPPPDR